jgi:glycine hydroxymethyltransferase
VDWKLKGLTGAQAESYLESVNITCNKNPVPNDPSNPKKWTGLRLGTASGTTRGMDSEAFRQIGNLIADTLDAGTPDKEPGSEILARVKAQVMEICQRYPTYND